MKQPLIKVEGLCKKFSNNLRSSMLYAACDISKSMLGMGRASERLRKNEFWALQDINFELYRGEVLGLIGRNGSGKSTLLRLLCGIFPPDKGRIEINGRIGALISVGAGFHPHMTGRENIFLNGVIIGMSSVEIKTKLNKIIDFAEIGEFVDAPVSTYSNGMRVRLGFAIAVHSNPDILLIDEILAVGDMSFRKKSLDKIFQLIDSTAVVFVSHAMPMIMRISNRILLMENSRIEYLGPDVEQGVKKYQKLFTNKQKLVWGKENIILNDFQILDKTGKNSKNFNNGDEITLNVHFELITDVQNYSINFVFCDQNLNNIAILSSIKGENDFNSKKGSVSVKFINQFAPGNYTININVNEMNKGQEKKRLFSMEALESINIVSSKIHGSIPIQLNGNWKII